MLRGIGAFVYQKFRIVCLRLPFFSHPKEVMKLFFLPLVFLPHCQA